MVVASTLPSELQQILDQAQEYILQDLDITVLIHGFAYCHLLLKGEEPISDEDKKKELVTAYVPILDKAYKSGIEAQLRNINQNIDTPPSFLIFSSIMNEAFSYLNNALESDQFYKYPLCVSRANMFLTCLVKNAFLDGRTYASIKSHSK
jgi:hypothetical protein